MNYKKGLAPVAENLYFKEMILNEHIRYPHKKRDIDDILNIFNKICKI